MNEEAREIVEEYRRRLPKGSLYRGGPTQRRPEDVVVEMVLEERATSHGVLESYIAGFNAERRKLLARIAELEARVR